MYLIFRRGRIICFYGYSVACCSILPFVPALRLKPWGWLLPQRPVRERRVIHIN